MEITVVKRETAIIDRVVTYEVDGTEWISVVEAGEDLSEALLMLKENHKVTFLKEDIELVEVIMTHDSDID
jgi:hypothetical protein